MIVTEKKLKKLLNNGLLKNITTKTERLRHLISQIEGIDKLLADESLELNEHSKEILRNDRLNYTIIYKEFTKRDYDGRRE